MHSIKCNTHNTAPRMSLAEVLETFLATEMHLAVLLTLSSSLVTVTHREDK